MSLKVVKNKMPKVRIARSVLHPVYRVAAAQHMYRLLAAQIWAKLAFSSGSTAFSALLPCNRNGPLQPLRCRSSIEIERNSRLA
jgi:hypothetical protein